MLDEQQKPLTSHSKSPVPFILCNNDYSLKEGKLGDIAPTILNLLKIDIPNEMTGELLTK